MDIEQLHVSIIFPNLDSICCTFVYAECNYVDRRSLWSDLRSLATNISFPWLVGCDFNVVLSPNKCLGTFPPILPFQEFAKMILIVTSMIRLLFVVFILYVDLRSLPF